MPDLTLRGIIAATVCPMTDSFEIDLPALRTYIQWLVDEGVHGLAVNVDTGEGPHLSHEERLGVLETVRTVVGDRLPVISGLGADWTNRGIVVARELRAAGADALLVFPPGAFRGVPLPAEPVVDYYRSIGEGADVPLVLFQLQEDLGGVEFATDVLVAVAALPHVVAIKEATFDTGRFQETVSVLKSAEVDLAILTGNDNFIYESFLLGAQGALIGFGTVATRMQVEMFEAHEAGDRDRAAALGARIEPLVEAIFAPPIRNYRARLKEALKTLGVIPSAAIRPPLPEVPPEEKRRIEAALEALDDSKETSWRERS